MKNFGFGLMRLPTTDPANAGAIDVEQVKKMVDLFIKKGFTYFDTAWMYCGFQSEPTVKEVLTSRYPREAFTLASKLHSGFFNSLEERDAVFQEQLKKTGVEYFDYYMLHGIESSSLPKYEQLDCFHWLKDKKEAGLVKTAGISFHATAELLDEILTKYPFIEFVQLQINYLDWESQWIQSKACYDVAVKHGKWVIVMEPVKGGTLAKVPAEVEALFQARDAKASAASWAVRFAASLPGVKMVLSGMSSLEQMEDNLSYMEHFQPLTEEETAMVFKAGEIINSQIAVPCTGCSYCTEGCPQKIAIPQYFSLYNEDMRERLEEKGWTVNFSHYANLAKSFGKAADCIGCGQCEEMCPQHLPIVEKLKEVSRHFDQ